MKFATENLKKLLLIMLCAVTLLAGCNRSEPAQARPETVVDVPVTTQAENIISGTVTQWSETALAMRSKDGTEYTFTIGAATAVTGIVEPGCMVEVRFYGSLSGASIVALSVTVLQPPTTTAAPETTIAPETEKSVAQQELSDTQKIMQNMTLEQKVGQMFITRCPDSDAAAAVEQYQPGGYVLFARDFKDQTPDSVRTNIRSYQDAAVVDMLIAVDEEGGDVNRVSLYTQFRQTPFWSPQKLYNNGGWDLVVSDTREKATLLKSLGINLNLAPVCDVANKGSYIYSRTFGADAKLTAEYVSRVVFTMNEYGIGSALKHFPGYGDNVNTHTGIAYDDRDYNTFQTRDFLPFQAGIQSGAGAVLVSHNIVKCMDAEYPASLSPKVHEILRDELQFTGVIMTDDLYMDAIKEYTGGDASKAAVQAIKAGNDLLCCSDFKTQIPAAIQAVKSGEISIERVEESVLRILNWKLQLGIIQPPAE